MSSLTSLFMPRFPSEYVGSTISRWIARYLAPRLWERCVIEAGTRCHIPTEILVDLHRSRCLARFFLNAFQSDRPVPKATDIAVSFAFHLRELCVSQPLASTVSTSQIRCFGALLRRCWLEGLQRNPVLQVVFKDVRNLPVSHFLSQDAGCTEEFDQTLLSVEQLQRSYFLSFSVADATHSAYVWLADAHHCVHIDEHAIFVKVPVNITRGCDVGFFQANNDYSLSDKDPMKWLFISYGDDKTGCEYGRFDDEQFFGKETANILWLR